MIYLIIKMFFYLLVAAGIGGAAGWLLRNLQAQQAEEKARREVADAKSKVPQLESLLRGRDEQVAKLKNEIRERRQENKNQVQEIKAAAQELQEQRREANHWKQKAQEKKTLSLEDGFEADDATNEMIAELSQEIVDLKAELAKGTTASAGQLVNEPDGVDSGRAAEFKKQQELLNAELDASRLHVSQLERMVHSAKTDLDRQKNTVRELEREREMQNKSLQVLHQQLELERSNRLASG